MPPRPRRPIADVGPAPRRLLVDERRQQLLELGMDAFAARAYDDVSIDDVARAAGISKGLVYHYFPTKRDFYVATVREGARRLVQTVVPPRDLPPDERLRRAVDAYLAYVGEHATMYTALLRSGVGSDPEVARILDGVRTRFLDHLLEDLPVASRPPMLRAVLRGWIGFVEAISLDWVEHRDVGAVELRDVIVAALLQTVERVMGRLG